MGLRRSVAEKGGVHTPEGSWSISRGTLTPRSNLAVYDRQAFRAPVLGAGAETGATAGVTFFEDDSVRIWHQNDDVDLVLQNQDARDWLQGVVAGMEKRSPEAEKNFKGLVIWHADAAEGGAFSAGADLQTMLPLFMSGGVKSDQTAVSQLQNASSIEICQRSSRRSRNGLGTGRWLRIDDARGETHVAALQSISVWSKSASAKYQAVAV